jgi:hypothetical protein
MNLAQYSESALPVILLSSIVLLIDIEKATHYTLIRNGKVELVGLSLLNILTGRSYKYI